MLERERSSLCLQHRQGGSSIIFQSLLAPGVAATANSIGPLSAGHLRLRLFLPPHRCGLVAAAVPRALQLPGLGCIRSCRHDCHRWTQIWAVPRPKSGVRTVLEL